MTVTSDRIGSILPALTRRIPAPIYLWSGFGIAALLAQAIVLGQWLASGDIGAPPTQYTIPTSWRVLIWLAQGVNVVLLVVMTVLFVRQYRRDHRISLFAAYFWGNWFTWWLAPIMIYETRSVAVSYAAVQVRDWGEYIPGWHPPYPEMQIEQVIGGQILMWPLSVAWPWAMLLIVATVNRRFPHWGRWRMAGVFVAAGLMADLIIEGFYIGTGTYIFPYAIHSLSLFGGHWYQIPLLQLLQGLIWMATIPALMQWNSQRRNTVPSIFRGSETLSRTRQTWLRLLAGVGLANLCLGGFVVCEALIPLLGTSPPPADIPAWFGPLP